MEDSSSDMCWQIHKCLKAVNSSDVSSEESVFVTACNALHCVSFQATINIVFDRVGKTDPVTRGIEITVNYLGIQFDVSWVKRGMWWATHSESEASCSFSLLACSWLFWGTIWNCHTVFTPFPQVKFWSQHISFILVGIIIVTSIRGLLITLTKVSDFPSVILWDISLFFKVSGSLV